MNGIVILVMSIPYVYMYLCMFLYHRAFLPLALILAFRHTADALNNDIDEMEAICSLTLPSALTLTQAQPQD